MVIVQESCWSKIGHAAAYHVMHVISYGETDRQTDRHRQTDGRTDRQTDGRTDVKLHCIVCSSWNQYVSV